MESRLTRHRRRPLGVARFACLPRVLDGVSQRRGRHFPRWMVAGNPLVDVTNPPPILRAILPPPRWDELAEPSGMTLEVSP
jgi:hypothetical protein